MSRQVSVLNRMLRMQAQVKTAKSQMFESSSRTSLDATSVLALS